MSYTLKTLKLNKKSISKYFKLTLLLTNQEKEIIVQIKLIIKKSLPVNIIQGKFRGTSIKAYKTTIYNTILNLVEISKKQKNREGNKES